MKKNENNTLELNSSEFALATDFYELTMAAAYFKSNQRKTRAVFELFVRKLPRNRSYMVAAGLDQALEYLNNSSKNNFLILEQWTETCSYLTYPCTPQSGYYPAFPSRYYIRD